jgi:outer membrane protein assembly factor BamB
MPEKALRLWPGVAAVALLWIGRFAVPAVFPDALETAVLSSMVFGLLVVVWWLFFSKVPIVERWGIFALLVAGLAISYRLVDASISNGMMGMMLPIMSTPILSLALVAGAALTRNASDLIRRGTMAALLLVGCFGWTLVRTNGVSGSSMADFDWRWTPTAEAKLLATAPPLPPPAPEPIIKPVAAPVVGAVAVEAPAVAVPKPVETAAPVKAIALQWPSFRGAARNSVVTSAILEPNWATAPPKQIWKRPIGPGWSSFAVSGDLLFTQEQRGEDELVSCYRVSTGEPVWIHRDAARFWESNAGAGPRGTPALHNGRIYSLGATGILNALNARNGALLWTRNASADTKTKLPGWGYAGSPLVVGDKVIVAASGALAAYDLETGNPSWKGPSDFGGGYSSPQLVTIAGVPQILLMTSVGVVSVAPEDGKPLWEHRWPTGAIVQPAVTADGAVLISDNDKGMRRLNVTKASDGWKVEERWTSNGLKPYFSDFVVHNGHAIGFDGRLISCIDLADGKRKWKGGRYGNGQMILLPGPELLVILSEEGELALVKASTGEFTELAKLPAIEGKTWNHPVLAGDVLLVRNSQEMAAFRLSH